MESASRLETSPFFGPLPSDHARLGRLKGSSSPGLLLDVPSTAQGAAHSRACVATPSTPEQHADAARLTAGLLLLCLLFPSITAPQSILPQQSRRLHVLRQGLQTRGLRLRHRHLQAQAQAQGGKSRGREEE